MTLQEVYRQYDLLNTPYQKDMSVTLDELHQAVLEQIDSIGNSNPHWNKLNEIETTLRNWYPF